jgi:hypothetical protein
VPYLVGRAERNDITVVVDGFGPMLSVIGPLERAGVAVETYRVSDVVNAAAHLSELVQTGAVAHQRDPRFVPCR